MYYESELNRPPHTTRPEDPVILTVKEHSDRKRDVPSAENTFTAKDVAALEVIVDLMKNTLSYEEKDVASVFNNNYMHQPIGTKSASHYNNDTTNSIQVHIAIPFDLQPGKKRSPLDPVRVRKVFSAKMSSPVDLEYQVHSFEGTMPPTVANLQSTPYLHMQNISYNSTFPEDSGGLSPGMYLLVDKPRSGYALKPVKAKVDLSALKTRQAAAVSSTPAVASTSASATSAVASSTAAITENKQETTSIKSLAKVTLSKDFIAAVNKQLIELYENMTRVSKDTEQKERDERELKKKEEKKTRKTRAIFKHNASEECTDESVICKRRIDWDAVKKYFGHDRVCNCKCKANKAMCRACAASDAVIDELTFEFDNLGNYMRDHCTEIQTFFWMNPTGGQKLRDSVSKIDKSLGDYYKRVKGKCQGRPCKTFSNIVDKRRETKITKTHTVPKQEAVKHLLDDLSGIAEDLNKTVALKTCFNRKLKEEGEKFLRAINNCLQKKHLEKRTVTSMSTKRKLIKNVYSLDNINVNIICNPEVTSTTDTFYPTTVQVPHSDTPTTKVGDHLFDYEIDDTKHKKRKGFKKLFPRKNKKDKMFTYYVPMYTTSKKSKLHFKRQVDEMVTPLISDGGGSFWYDYLKGSTRVVRESSRETPKFGIAVLQTGGAIAAPHPPGTSTKARGPVNKIYMTVKTNSKKRKMQRDTDPMYETTTDYLSHNINQLLQLFGSLQDIEAMNMNSNRSTMFLAHRSTKSKKVKTKKTTKPAKPIKTVNKMHYRGPTTPSEARPQPVKVSSTTIKPESKDMLRPNVTEPADNKMSNAKVAAIPTVIPESTTKIIENSTLSSKETSQIEKEATAYDPSDPYGKLDSTKPYQTDTTSSLDSTTSTTTTNSTYSPFSNMSSPDTTGTSMDTTTPTPFSTTPSTPSTPTTPTTPTYQTQFTTKPAVLNNMGTASSTKKFDFVVADTRVLEAPATSAKQASVKTTQCLMGKIKTATFKFFENVGKGYTFNEMDTPTTIVPYRSDSSFEQTESANLDKISETEMNLMAQPDTPEAQGTTHMSPTIVIINEYDNPMNNDVLNDPNRDIEGYKNLLLSIIQYETNKLNDEWHKIAYGSKERDEDVKRSIIQMKGDTTPK